jgi:AAA+ ATPase superfamily predicted ATPase
MKKQRSNPFQFGVVVDDRAFCNRAGEISFLKSQIKNGYSTWLFSPRRFGKTSLVEKVFREINDTTCLYVDLYNIRSVDDFCRKYSKVLAEQLFNWKDDIRKLTHKLANAFKGLSPAVSFGESGNPSFSLNIQRVEDQKDIETILDVPGEISRRSKKRICIAFDEFQEIARIDPFMSHWMRSSFQRHADIAYIFLGSKQSLMEEIFASMKSPFYEFAVKMNLSTISKAELHQFIRQNFENHDVPIAEKTIDTLLEKSECQPHYTQYFASVVFDLTKAGYDQEDEGFTDKWLNRIIIPQSDVFQDIYDQLTNSQRAAIQALSRINSNGIFSESVRARYDLPVTSTLNEALKALQKKGLVYKTDESYRIANPIFKEWLLRL